MASFPNVPFPAPEGDSHRGVTNGGAPDSPFPGESSSRAGYYPAAAPASAGFSASPGGGTTGGLDWRHLGQTLLERLWVILLLTLTGLFLALGYLAKSPRLYQSRLTLEIQAQEPSLVDVGGGQGGGPRPGSLGGVFGMASQEAMRTVEQNLRNRPLMVRVLRSEGLTGAEGARALFGIETATAPGVANPPPSEEALAGALSGMVNATLRRNTRLIDVFVIHRDPALARRLAEAVGREYIRASIERRHDFAQESLRFLVEEAERLKTKLQTSERAVSDYKANTPDALALGGGTASTGSGANTATGRGGLAESRMEDLSNKLTAAKTDRLRAEEALAQIDRVIAASPRGGGTEALLAIPAIANAPAVVERRRDLAQVQGAVAALSQRYKDKHPKMIAARAALEQTQAGLAQAVAAQPALLRSVVESAQAGEASLQAASKEQEKAAVALNRAAIPYQELARQVETDRALYENVLRQIKQTDLAKEASRSDSVSVIEHASTPGGPISPQPPKAIAAGVIGGLAAGLALVALLAALDRSVKTVDQAEALSGLPVLAAIPELNKEGKSALKPSPMPARVAAAATASGNGEAEPCSPPALADEGPVTEAFRSLRAALSMIGSEADRRVFLFTSALPSEGKSFTSANYALSLAQQGHRVLLVDGDLRRPSLHRVFNLESNGGFPAQRGLVDYLIGGVRHGKSATTGNGDAAAGEAPSVLSLALPVTMPLPGVVVGNHEGGQLFVMTAGSRSPNPAELLSGGGGAGVGRLIAEALLSFDRIVIDSAPVLAVSDTLLLLPYAQTTCVVVRAKKTARNALVRTLALLGQAQAAAVGHNYLRQHSISGGAVAPCAGLVLNRMPRRRGLGYYYYYSEHGYGYGPESPRRAGNEPGRGGKGAEAAAGRQPSPVGSHR